MRQLTSHKVAGNESNEVDIIVADAAGSGGANHHYKIFKVGGTQLLPYPELLAEVQFQNGPILTNGINGVTQEVLLAIVADRLQSFQAGPFPCQENADALGHVSAALEILKQRTIDRIARAVEGQLKA
jgi:hypothetical protein